MLLEKKLEFTKNDIKNFDKAVPTAKFYQGIKNGQAAKELSKNIKLDLSWFTKNGK